MATPIPSILGKHSLEMRSALPSPKKQKTDNKTDTKTYEYAYIFLLGLEEQLKPKGIYKMGRVFHKADKDGFPSDQISFLKIAKNFYLKAANAGVVQAQFRLGKLYATEKALEETEDAKKLAFDWIDKAAKADDDKALFYLGYQLYFNYTEPTYPFPKNLPEDAATDLGLDYLEKAASLGNAKAIQVYADILYGRTNDLDDENPEEIASPSSSEKDWNQSWQDFTWQFFAANLGNKEAQKVVGDHHKDGLKSENCMIKNLEEAAKWYERAMTSGNQDARIALAQLHRKEHVNLEKVMELISPVAEAGNREAQQMIVDMLQKGEITPKTINQARLWGNWETSFQVEKESEQKS